MGARTIIPVCAVNLILVVSLQRGSSAPPMGLTPRQASTRTCLALVLSCCIGLSACSTTPDSTNTGPFPVKYREMAKDYLRKTLFDPYSVRDAEIAEPQVRQSFYLIDPSPAWTICVRYNAKNRMGGYTGLKENALLVRGERVTKSLNELTEATPTVGLCKDAKWTAFPELGS